MCLRVMCCQNTSAKLRGRLLLPYLLRSLTPGSNPGLGVKIGQQSDLRFRPRFRLRRPAPPVRLMPKRERPTVPTFCTPEPRRHRTPVQTPRPSDVPRAMQRGCTCVPSVFLWGMLVLMAHRWIYRHSSEVSDGLARTQICLYSEHICI